MNTSQKFSYTPVLYKVPEGIQTREEVASNMMIYSKIHNGLIRFEISDIGTVHATPDMSEKDIIQNINRKEINWYWNYSNSSYELKSNREYRVREIKLELLSRRSKIGASSYDKKVFSYPYAWNNLNDEKAKFFARNMILIMENKISKGCPLSDYIINSAKNHVEHKGITNEIYEHVLELVATYWKHGVQFWRILKNNDNYEMFRIKIMRQKALDSDVDNRVILKQLSRTR